MTLTFYKDYSELFDKAVLWFKGDLSTNLGFPILPTGVTVTPTGTFTTMSLGNSKSVLVFDGSTNYISLSDNDAWLYYGGDFTVCFWIKAPTPATNLFVLSQYDGINYFELYYSPVSLGWHITGGSSVGNYKCDSELPNNIFAHISILRFGSTTLMYINGISQTVVIITPWGAGVNISAPLIIGGESPSTYSPACNIKDLIIYKGRALTVPEIKMLMIKTSPITGSDVYPLFNNRRTVE